MATAMYRVRAAVRVEWRSLLAVALLVGLAGGAVLASLGAASRTDTAFSRMRHATNAWDILVNPNNGSDSKLTMAELRKLPAVQAIGRVDGVILYPSFVKSISDAFSLPPFLIADRNATYTIGRPLMTAGHQPAPRRSERRVGRANVRRIPPPQGGPDLHLHDHHPELAQRGHGPALAVRRRDLDPARPANLKGTLRIDGIGVMSDGVVVDPGYTSASFLLTPAFAAAHPDLQVPYWGAMVKLKPGTNVDAFTAQVRALVPQESIAFQRASAVTAEVVDATEPEVMALEAFAALAALLGLVVVSQAISRRLQIDARHNPTLAAIGMTRSQRAAESLAKSMLAVVVGAALAVVIAVAASGLGPVGAVRVAEVHPGIRFDWSLLLAGGVSVIAMGALLSVIPGLAILPLAGRGDRGTKVSGGRAWSRPGAGRWPRSLGSVSGWKPGPRRTSVPVRTTLLAAATRSRPRHVGGRVLDQPQSPARHSTSLRRPLGRPGRAGRPQQRQRPEWVQSRSGRGRAAEVCRGGQPLRLGFGLVAAGRRRGPFR